MQDDGAAIVERIRNPDRHVLAAIWRNWPSPIDVDTENPDAIKRLLRALIRAASSNQYR